MYTANLINRPFYAPEDAWENIVAPVSTEFLPKLLPDDKNEFYSFVDTLFNKALTLLNNPNYTELTAAVWDAEDPACFSADAGLTELLNAPEGMGGPEVLPLDAQVYLSYYNAGIALAFDAFKEGLRNVLYNAYDLRRAFYKLGLPEVWGLEVENLSHRPNINDPSDLPQAVHNRFFHVEEIGYKHQLKELRLWISAVLHWNLP